MTSIFDGMAGALNDVFGAPLTYTVAGGSAAVVQGILRLGPTEATDSEGYRVIIAAPTLRLRRDQVPAAGRGDTVVSARHPGRVFSVLNRIETSSPADDGFVLLELEEPLA